MIKTIGNTPLIKIKYEYEGKTNYIYTKLESYNLTGSIKDRAAYYIITKAKENFRFDLNDYKNIGKNKENIVVYFSRMGYTKKIAYESRF